MAVEETTIQGFPQLFKWSRAYRWSDRSEWRSLIPHDQPGVYVFLNYRDRTPQYAEDWSGPNYPGSWIGEPTRHNLYVGEALGRSLFGRLTDYLDRPEKCQPQLIAALGSYPDHIWLRWSPCFDPESEYIAHLDPVFNIQQRSTATQAAPSLQWDPWVRWTDVRDRKVPITDHPGCYAFTNYGGPGHRLSPTAQKVTPAQLDGTELVALTGRRVRLVLYVGQGESLANRLDNYRSASANPDQQNMCSVPLSRLLRDAPDQIWVRWLRHFKFENELIWALKPAFNTKHNPRT